MTIPILLLAAGRSSRMGGRDKLMEIVDGEPLIRRSAGIAARVGPVIAALPPAPHPRHDALAGMSIRIVEVPDRDEGIAASLRATLAAVPGDAPAAMVLLADLPELTAEDLCHVRDAVDPASDTLIWRGATGDGRPGHPTVFARALFGALMRCQGDSGAQPVLRAQAAATKIVPLTGERARRDLDTPEDWAEWRKARGEEPAPPR